MHDDSMVARLMSITATDIHGIATRLWNGSAIVKTEEVCVRTAAGRAYYSAYHCTREAMRAAYSQPTYDVQHRPLATFMIGSGVPLLRQAGYTLKRLRVAREQADYRLDESVSHAYAEVLIDGAQELLVQQSEIRAAFRQILPRKP